MADYTLDQQTDALETLLLALNMHPMFMRQPFAILQLALQELPPEALDPNLAELQRYFAALPRERLFAAWAALHNPFRLESRTLN